MAGSPHPEALRLAKLLEKTGAQLVLAESCTGGLTAALLTQVPGISKNFCGSAVVYQSETKSSWLKIDQSLLKRYGTESTQTSRMLALKVLKKTPQATISGAITGDLGPLPRDPKKVGTIFVACAIKRRGKVQTFAVTKKIRFPQKTKRTAQTRIALQHAASMVFIRMVRQMLTDTLRQHLC
ncbi:MAG: CinA family protein [Oligoflexia bacterium]